MTAESSPWKTEDGAAELAREPGGRPRGDQGLGQREAGAEHEESGPGDALLQLLPGKDPDLRRGEEDRGEKGRDRGVESVPEIREPQSRREDQDGDDPFLFSAQRRELPGRINVNRSLGRRVDPVRPEASQDQEEVIRNAHEKEPAPPGKSSQQGCGSHGRQSTGHEGRRGERVQQAQGENDRFDQPVFPLQLQFPKSLFVSGEENGVPGDRRGEDEGHGRERKEAVGKEPPGASPGPSEKEDRRPPGEAALHRRPAHGHDSHQEIKDGRKKAVEKVVYRADAAGHRQQDENQKRADPHRESFGGPENDGQQHYGDHPLPLARKSGERGQQHK